MKRNKRYNQENKQEIKKIKTIDDKYIKLFDAVKNQDGYKGKLIIMDFLENPYSVLLNAITLARLKMKIINNQDKDETVLTIDDCEIAKGKFINSQTAKSELAKNAIKYLSKYCFIIKKQPIYETISANELTKSQDNQPTTTANELPENMTSSIAHKIMLKMGWNGGGLGAQEQGEKDFIKISPNIKALGFGTSEIMKNVRNRLMNHKKSKSLDTLYFDYNFSKEDRANIHEMAKQLQMISTSVNGDNGRRITISNRFSYNELILRLLQVNCVSARYELFIPEKFQHLYKQIK